MKHEKMNSLLCPCDKCIHWEKYEEYKICNVENICSNEEEMKEYHKENNSITDENNTSEEEHMNVDEQDTNCSETLRYCAHCDYATKRKFNIEDHIERKHAPEEVIICSNNEKSDIVNTQLKL